jgi:sugar/nucleoside kinase (ribokinase family)
MLVQMAGQQPKVTYQAGFSVTVADTVGCGDSFAAAVCSFHLTLRKSGSPQSISVKIGASASNAA